MNRRNRGRPADAAAAWWLVPLLLALAVGAGACLVGLLEQMSPPETPLASAQPAR